MSKKDMCEIYCYDEEKVARVKGELQTINITDVVQLFKVVADENRAKIIFALSKSEELCVCDLANAIGITVANASHHLRTLHKQGVVKFRKEGRLAFYSLDDAHINQLLAIALTHREGVGANV